MSEIFEHAFWGMFHTTATGQYFAANNALARIYGYDFTKDLLVAFKDIAVQIYVDPLRRGVLIQTMRDDGAVSGLESEVYRRDGTRIWISESCREVRSTDGGLLYYEGSVEDISKRKQIEADLVAAEDQAERANRGLANFLAHMGHELRTPLNAVIGFSQLIKDRALGPLPQGYVDYAGFINDAGTNLMNNINDILKLVDLKSQRLVPDDDVISVSQLVHLAVKEQEDQIHRAGLDLQIDIRSHQTALIADLQLLKKALLNLLANAVKFTEPGGRITIATQDMVEGGFALSVIDTGCGMDKDEIARACVPFFQAEALLTRRHEGMGIGLAIARAAVELHEGSLLIQPTPEGGTEVRLELPPTRVHRE